ncbi:MAG: rod shape-determining protein MreD [Candidatus Aminicenantes bacterium]|nr:MAG: rod shape-determining protein MreD [Candidatus Aminicenantes bacterium]
MKDLVGMLLSVIAAFLLYSLLAKISVSMLFLFNFFSLIVIYFALEKGEIYGAFLGAFCGLLQDSFSMSIFGVAGIAKTIIGYSAGYFSSKINVTPIRRNFVFVFLLLCVELIIWSMLYSFIFSERVNTGEGLIFFQPLITAALGSLAFYLIRKLKSTKI